MKSMGREVVKFHYQAELNPEIEHNHNSDQRYEVIADNVKKLINESLFFQGPLDNHVSFFVMNNQPC